jgi:hypothetical protein
MGWMRSFDERGDAQEGAGKRRLAMKANKDSTKET